MDTISAVYTEHFCYVVSTILDAVRTLGYGAEGRGFEWAIDWKTLSESPSTNYMPAWNQGRLQAAQGEGWAAEAPPIVICVPVFFLFFLCLGWAL